MPQLDGKSLWSCDGKVFVEVVLMLMFRPEALTRQ